MAFRLRYLAHDLEVPVGRFVIGRHAECQLSLDDPMVSRRHAMLVVEPNGTAFVEDLDSRNGVFVNGARVEGMVELGNDDVIQIGSQRMSIHDDRGGEARRAALPPERDTELPAAPLEPPPAAPVPPLPPPPASGTVPRRRLSSQYEMDAPTMARGPGVPAAKPDRRVSSLSLIGGVADKALALGRAEQAARVLYRPLVDVLAKARDGSLDEEGLAETAAVYATRLASATGRGEWVDFVFQLYTALRELVPAYLVDELYAVLRRVDTIDRAVLATYCEWLRTEAPRFGPSERFVQQRIEGLERLGALK
jgi:hypothetical protein